MLATMGRAVAGIGGEALHAASKTGFVRRDLPRLLQNVATRGFMSDDCDVPEDKVTVVGGGAVGAMSAKAVYDHTGAPVNLVSAWPTDVIEHNDGERETTIPVNWKPYDEADSSGCVGIFSGRVDQMVQYGELINGFNRLFLMMNGVQKVDNQHRWQVLLHYGASARREVRETENGPLRVIRVEEKFNNGSVVHHSAAHLSPLVGAKPVSEAEYTKLLFDKRDKNVQNILNFLQTVIRMGKDPDNFKVQSYPEGVRDGESRVAGLAFLEEIGIAYRGIYPEIAKSPLSERHRTSTSYGAGGVVNGRVHRASTVDTAVQGWIDNDPDRVESGIFDLFDFAAEQEVSVPHHAGLFEVMDLFKVACSTGDPADLHTAQLTAQRIWDAAVVRGQQIRTAEGEAMYAEIDQEVLAAAPSFTVEDV